MLHWSQGNPRSKYGLGEELIENIPAEKGLDVLVDGKLNLNQQCMPIDQMARLDQKQCGQQAEGGDSPPRLCPCDTPPGVLGPPLGCFVQEK
ncbi:hypothetical protein DUI87_10188 [Hirundo rustica rustica]|uniref:Uncharacterized protein n=1 Tax=Hirundo rustica rustica TaxID=333673 RepID=A0A3M0KN44_HIRRU|nr:hypothetical protein DUI87_10188 [Hirundo rustica rustica]